MLVLRVQKLGDTMVIHCVGRITFPYAHRLRTVGLHPSVRTLVLDLAEVMAMDAAGLGELVGLRAWARRTGMLLKLMNVTPTVDKLLQLTNLKSRFEICSTREMLALLCRAIREAEQMPFEPTMENVNGIHHGAAPGYLLRA